MPRFKIQSVLVSPDPWLFTKTTAESFSDKLEFVSPEEHDKYDHFITFETDSLNLKEAWKEFHTLAEEFIRAAVFYTSSYMVLQDWRNLVIDRDLNAALISVYNRTQGTGLSIYSSEEKDNLSKLILKSQDDDRLKKFLHNYKMAVLTDSPETHNAYEKYLLLAAESLAGKITDEDGYRKLDRPRLKQIIGNDLHDFFFQHVDIETGNNIRNLHMHEGESPNSKPSETIKLIEKFKSFIKQEYDIQYMHEIEVQHSPTRGLYRDDGGFVLARSVNDEVSIEDLDIKECLDSDTLIKKLLEDGFEILNLGNGEGREIYIKMMGI